MSGPLTPAQYRAMAAAMNRWLTIRARHDRRFHDLVLRPRPSAPPPEDDEDDRLWVECVAIQLAADIWHSALLWRMLVDGKPPLPEPPPVKNSYPVYPDYVGEGEPEE